MAEIQSFWNLSQDKDFYNYVVRAHKVSLETRFAVQLKCPEHPEDEARLILKVCNSVI